MRNSIIMILLCLVASIALAKTSFVTNEVLTATKLQAAFEEKGNQAAFSKLSAAYRDYSAKGRFDASRHTRLSSAQNRARKAQTNYSSHWNPGTWDARYHTRDRQTSYSAARQADIDSKATSGRDAVFAKISTTAADGKRGLNVKNSSPYTGDKRGGTIFHNGTTMYFCDTDNNCKRMGSGGSSSTTTNNYSQTIGRTIVTTSGNRTLANNTLNVVTAGKYKLPYRNSSTSNLSIYANSTGVYLVPNSRSGFFKWRNYSSMSALFSSFTGHSVKLQQDNSLDLVHLGSPLWIALTRVSLVDTGRQEYIIEPATGTILFGDSAEGVTELALAGEQQLGYGNAQTASWSETSSTATVGTVEAYIQSQSSTRNCKAFITDSAGTILAVSNVTLLPSSSTPAWHVFTFASPPIVTKGSGYRIGVVMEGVGNTVHMRYTNTGTNTIAYKTGSYASPIAMTGLTNTDTSATLGLRAKK